MNRLSINISGYIYVADLYSIEDNISINKDFIMIRSLSLIENDVYNNEIFVIDKDIYDLNKESIIYPVVNEVERYSQNISDFLDINNFNSSEFYDNEGNITGQTNARRPKSSLQLQGLGHMQAIAEYDDITGENKIKFDYDLHSAVSNEQFTLDSNAKYNLAVVDGQIKMQKYVPISLKVSSLPVCY